MTRELKLALIVGFALVLVVTVLVSDHLSRARKAQLAPPASDAARLAATPEAPIKPNAEPPVRMLPATDDALPVPPQREPMIAQGPAPSATPPVKINQGGAEPGDDRLTLKQDDPEFELLQTLRKQGLDIVTRGGERVIVPLIETRTETIPTTPATAKTDDAAAKLRESLRDSLRESGANTSTPAAGNTAQPEIRKADNNNSRTPPAPTTPTAGERTHNVAAGESLAAISKRYYGSESQWRRLAAFNKLPDNGAVRQGARLRIPTVEVLTGRTTPASQPTVQPSNRPAPTRVEDAMRNTRTASAKQPETKPTAKPETKPKTDRPREYVVARGDTLGSIAQRLLGSSRRAEELVALNQLDDEDSVVIGTRLRLPSN